MNSLYPFVVILFNQIYFSRLYTYSKMEVIKAYRTTLKNWSQKESIMQLSPDEIYHYSMLLL